MRCWTGYGSVTSFFVNHGGSNSHHLDMGHLGLRGIQ
jgi:hypothetical protein